MAIKPLTDALERRQNAVDARRDWLRSLKTGDAVALTTDGADRLKTTERVTVTRDQATGGLYAEGHRRRDLRGGTWRRGGKAWLWLRIDPVGEA
jgi:hypothetical protein